MRFKIFALLSFSLALSVPVTAGEKTGLLALAESALAHAPDRLKATAELKAAESDAAAERAKRLLSGTVSGSAGREDALGTGSSSTSQANSYSGALSATTVSKAGSTVTLGAEYGYAKTEKNNTDSATLNAGISLPVFVNGRLVDFRLDEAAKASFIDLPLETARETAAAKERSTVDAVLRLALDAAGAERARAIAERAADIAERETAIAMVKRSQGTLSYSELSKIEKEADEARLTALESRYSRDAKLRSLCAATGLDETAIRLPLLVAPGDAVPKAAEASGGTTQAMLGAARARKNTEMSRILSGTENAPTFALSAKTKLPGPATRDQDDFDPEEKGTWSAQASVAIPLPSGLGTARKKAADARVEAARLGEEAAVRAAADEARVLGDALTSASARVTLREDLLTQAESRLRDVLSSLNSQTATKLDEDRARLAVDEALAALEDARSARFKAVLDMYAFRGLDPLVLIKETQQ